MLLTVTILLSAAIVVTLACIHKLWNAISGLEEDVRHLTLRVDSLMEIVREMHKDKTK
jgi:hypothetical protein